MTDEKEEPANNAAVPPGGAGGEGDAATPLVDYSTAAARRPFRPGVIYTAAMFPAGFIFGCAVPIGVMYLASRGYVKADREAFYLVTALKLAVGIALMFLPHGRAFGLGVVLATIVLRIIAHTLLCGF